MNIEILRSRLADRRGSWGTLAALAGCNRKTIERIVHQPDYMPNLRTFNDLLSALDKSDRAQVA